MKITLYFCNAKKGCDGLYRQRSKSQAGHRAQPNFAKKGTLSIARQRACGDRVN